MKNRKLRELLSCIVGVLLITTWSVLVCTDSMICPLMIKEMIGSFCVGVCIGKIMWTIGKRKSESKGSEILKEEKYE